MFKKIVEFFTGKKPESSFAHPLDAVTTPSAPYKVPEPAATIPIPFVVTNSNPADNVPIPYRYEPPAAETTPPVAVLISPEPAPAKKPRKAAAPKPVVSKAPAKPRAKKNPQ